MREFRTRRQLWAYQDSAKRIRVAGRPAAADQKKSTGDVTPEPSGWHSSMTTSADQRTEHGAMPEYVIAAGVTVAGCLVGVLRVWIRARGVVQVEKIRGSLRRDLVRELPRGSRLVDRANRVTIEIGRSVEREGGPRGMGD